MLSSWIPLRYIQGPAILTIFLDIVASNTCGFCSGSIGVVYRSTSMSGPWERDIVSAYTCGGQVEGVLPLVDPATNQTTYVWHATTTREYTLKPELAPASSLTRFFMASGRSSHYLFWPLLPAPQVQRRRQCPGPGLHCWRPVLRPLHPWRRLPRHWRADPGYGQLSEIR